MYEGGHLDMLVEISGQFLTLRVDYPSHRNRTAGIDAQIL